MKIFVSYSWEKNEPDKEVLLLVNELRQEGYDANCDVMEIQQTTSINFGKMMAENLTEADKVIIVLSPSYKKKADSFSGGVGEEYQYIINDIKHNKTKYILVSFLPLSAPNVIDSITPNFLKGREIIDLSSSGSIRNSKLLFRLNNQQEYIFANVNSQMYIPESINLNIQKDLTSGFEVCKSTTTFFDYRLRSAFPGVRGLKIFEDPKECVDRLEIMLRAPLNHSGLGTPIWFFRGNSCLDIPTFQRLSNTKCVLGYDEYEIEKIGVYIAQSYYRDFIYIQTKPDQPTGVYPRIDYYQTSFYKNYGYYSEEYGLFGNKYITRQEYDDGATVIDGKVIASNGNFQLRVRYLTPYNFVLCAKFHPFNSPEGDAVTGYFLNEILRGNCTLDDFIEVSLKLPKNINDQMP